MLTGVAMLAACGSSAKTSASSGASPTSASGGGTSSAGGCNGVTSGLAPVKIGFVNMDKGQVPFPGGDEGATAATKYVNCELGGIGGHPLQLVTCGVDLTPATNQACGQQFANDSSIPVVMTVVTVEGAPLYAALNAVGTPIYGGIPTSPSDYTAPGNTFFMLGGAPAVNGGQGALAKQVVPNAKTIVIMDDDEPGGQAGVPIVEAAYGKGPKYVVVSVPTSASDALPYATQALSANPDAIVFALNDISCPKVEAVLLAQKTKVPLFGSNQCINPIAEKQTNLAGEYGAFYGPPAELSTGRNADVDLFKAKFQHYGGPAGTPATFAIEGWGEVITLHKILSGIAGIPTKANVTAALSAFHGPVYAGGQQVSCPGPGQYKRLCGATNAFGYRVSSDNTLQPIGNGDVTIDFGS